MSHNPFARKQYGLLPVSIFSFLLMCLVVAASIAYTPNFRSVVFAYITQINTILETANAAMFGTYMQVAGVAAAMVLPAQSSLTPEPAIELTATYVPYEPPTEEPIKY